MPKCNSDDEFKEDNTQKLDELDKQFIHKRKNLLDFQTTVDGDLKKKKILPKKYKNPLRMSQTSICPLPFNIDFYSNCSFKCTYCFARMLEKTLYQFAFDKGWNPNKIRPAETSIIYDHFEKGLGIKDHKGCKGHLVNAIKHKIPVHISAMSDSFQPIELKKHLTLDWLKWNNNNQDYPYYFSTKALTPAYPEYINEILKSKYVAAQVSLNSPSDVISLAIEPNAPPASDRLEMIKLFKEVGVPVFVRIVPVIPLITLSDTFELVRKLVELKVDNIQFQFLDLETTESMNAKYKNIFDVDLKNYYESFPDSTVNKNKMKFSKSFIRSYYIEIIKEFKKDIVSKNGNTTFTFNEHTGTLLSDNHTCCGVDKLKGFENWYEPNVMGFMNVLRKKGYTTWNDFKDSFYVSEKDKERFKNQYDYFYIHPFCVIVDWDTEGKPIYKLDWNKSIRPDSSEDRLKYYNNEVGEKVLNYDDRDSVWEVNWYLILWHCNRESKLRIMNKYNIGDYASKIIDLERMYGVDSKKIGDGKEYRPSIEKLHRKNVDEYKKKVENGEDVKGKVMYDIDEFLK